MIRATFGRALPGLAAVLLLLFSSVATDAARGNRDSEDLTNIFLSPSLSQWLVGAVGRIATEKEIDAFLSLDSDEQAREFIEEFWASRQDPDEIVNRSRMLFDERQAIADDEYTESAYPGRRTARGIIYTLYGAPEEVDYEVPKVEGGESVELWVYPKSAEIGLDGKKPLRNYRFVRNGDLTVFYDPSFDRKARRRSRVRRTGP